MRSLAAKLALVAAFAAVLSLPALAHGHAVFEDPAMKGSLIALPYPAIPPEYHGTWADRRENCYATSDRGRQVSLAAHAIGFDRPVKVEGYSDHPAVLVTAQSSDGEMIRVFFDLSLDREHIAIRLAGTDSADILIRCPPGVRPAEPGTIADAGWLTQAEEACGTEAFAPFLEAFMSSTFVERRHLAPRIRVVTAASSTSIPDHQYRPVPIRLLDDRYVLNDGSRTAVTVDVLKFGAGSYRIEWRRLSADDSQTEKHEVGLPEIYGPLGWLIFERTSTCWQLVEDGSDA